MMLSKNKSETKSEWKRKKGKLSETEKEKLFMDEVKRFRLHKVSQSV